MSRNTRDGLLQALRSYLRVFAAALIAAYLQLGVAPLDLALGDLKTLGNAGIAAALLTAFNALRSGETRFGLNKEPVESEQAGEEP